MIDHELKLNIAVAVSVGGVFVTQINIKCICIKLELWKHVLMRNSMDADRK